LERPHAGRIALGDQLWFDARRGINLSAERRRIGYLPQDYGLFPHLDVAANVRFAGRRDRPDLLERVGIAHLAGAKPRDLSGGERQRAALARALAREPRVLLLDEPFGALDAITRRQVRDQLADLLKALALPTLVVTHSFEDATILAERIAVIHAGRVVQVASAKEILREPATAMVAELTGANILEGIATPTAFGSTIMLTHGGKLLSSTTASGPVQIVVQPWELELADPASSMLSDSVLGVHSDHGRLIVRLTRFTIHADPQDVARFALTEGEPVGLQAKPTDIRVLTPTEAPPARSGSPHPLSDRTHPLSDRT